MTLSATIMQSLSAGPMSTIAIALELGQPAKCIKDIIQGLDRRGVVERAGYVVAGGKLVCVWQRTGKP